MRIVPEPWSHQGHIINYQLNADGKEDLGLWLYMWNVISESLDVSNDAIAQ